MTSDRRRGLGRVRALPHAFADIAASILRPPGGAGVLAVLTPPLSTGGIARFPFRSPVPGSPGMVSPHRPSPTSQLCGSSNQRIVMAPMEPAAASRLRTRNEPLRAAGRLAERFAMRQHVPADGWCRSRSCASCRATSAARSNAYSGYPEYPAMLLASKVLAAQCAGFRREGGVPH